MFPCPKCTSPATKPSSDKDWRDPVLRIFLIHALRCHHCNHRFRALATPGEWKRKQAGIRDPRELRSPAS